MDNLVQSSTMILCPTDKDFEKTLNLISGSKEEYFIEPLTVKEVLGSEDYTRVTIKGRNPKVTHSFCNFVLECCRDEFDYKIVIAYEGKKERISLIRDDLACRSFGENSECFCRACEKKIKVGDVVYVYKRSTWYCSFECASLEVLVEVIMGVVNKFSFHGNPVISRRLDDCNDLMFFMEGITI